MARKVIRNKNVRRFSFSNILAKEVLTEKLEERIVPAYVASDFGWASTLETTGVNVENLVRSSAVDASGNVYQVGSFTGTVDFDPGTGVTNLTAVGGQDAFVEKLDPTGQLVWVKAFSGSSSEKATSITLDASGNPIVTGWFQGTVDFDPGTGVTNINSQGAEDAFIVKLSSAGALQWAKSVGGSSSDGGMTITTDTSGNILLGGWFYGTADFDPSANVSSMTTNSGSNDIFVLKLDGNGAFTWVKGIIGLSNASKTIYDIKTDSNNNVAIAGIFNGILDLDPGAGAFQVNTAGGQDGFIDKLDSNGVFQWGQQIGSTGVDGVYGLAFDSQNSLYTAGAFTGTVDFDSSTAIQNRTSNGALDSFLLKSSNTGAFQWVDSWGGSTDDYASKNVSIDANNKIKVGGVFSGTVDFDPGAEVYSLTSTGGYDLVVSQFDTSGNFFGAQAVGQPNAGDDMWTMSLTATGRPVITGAFAGTMDFDPDSPIKSLPVTGASNTFVTQWNRLFSKTNLAISNSFDGSNTTLTATVVNEAGANPTGQVRFYDYYYGVLNTLGTSTISNGVATLTLATMSTGPHSIYAVYGGNTTTFSSKSNTVALSLDTVTGTFGYAEAFVNRVGTEEGSPITTTFTDKLGNIYYAGTFQGTIDFDSGTLTKYYTASGRDFFLAKLTPEGKLTWFKQWTGNTIEGITDSFVNAQDQIVFSGYFRNSMDFDPSVGTSYMVSNGGLDGFVMTLDLNGNYINSFSLGGSADDVINGVAYDSQNNLIVAGTFRNVVNFDPNSFGYNITSKGDRDAFVAKYDTSYYLMWADQIGNGNWQEFRDVALDTFDNIYVVGNTGDGNLDLDPSSLISPGTSGTFIAKYNKNGAYSGQVNADFDYAYKIAVQNNNIYLGGDYFSGTYYQPINSFISKYTSSLSKSWTAIFSTQNNWSKVNGISFVVDNSERVYITGGFNATADFDPGTGVYNLSTKGDFDVFFATLNSSGAFLSAVSVGSTWYDVPSAISLSPNGSVLISGIFTGEADFDPSTTVATLKSDVNNSGLRSRFLLNLTSQVPGIGTNSSLAAAPTASVYGQSVTLTATITALDSSTLNGITASFYDGSTLIGTGTVANGVATLSTASLAVGAHSLTVKSTDATNKYLTSTSAAVAFNVSKADTTSVVSGPATVNAGTNATFSVHVAAASPGSGTPTGTVQFYDGSTLLGSGTLNASGDASYSTTALTLGTHTITASYAGDTNYKVSTSAIFNSTVANGVASAIVIKAGNSQSATVAADYANLLQVQATDSSGNPVAGVSVTFTAPATGASGTFAASNTVTTDTNGLATAPKFTANTVAGAFTVTASASGVSNVSFSLTNTAKAAAAIVLAAGNSQSATVNTAFATALQAKVTDTYGNAVAGVSVTFTAPGTGASGTFATSSTVTTNASGLATAPALTANTVAGTYQLTVSSTGLTSQNFSLTNSPGAASTMAIFDGNNQSATVNATFVKTLQVVAKDTYGNVVPGVSVLFTAPGTGASGTFATSSTVSTNASGVAASPALTANTVAGTYLVSAASTGLTTLNFSLTNTAGAATSIAIVDGNSQSATVATAFAKTLQVVAKDTYGNLVPGLSVTFTAPASGASGTFATSSTVTTNASGVAVSPVFTANNTAGSYTVTAAATGLTTQNFSLTNSPGAAYAIVLAAGNNQSAVVNTAFATALQARVTDKFGNGVAGASVAFTAPATGASGTFATSSTITTDATGLALAPAFTANTVAGTYQVSAASTGLTTQNFSLTNSPAAAASIAIYDGNNQAATVGAAFAKALQVIAKDNYGNVVPGVSVTFSAPSTGASGTFASSSVIATNASGLAVAPTFTANTTAGSYTISAAATGLTTQNFSLTNNPAAASSLTIFDGNNQTATVGATFAKTLQVIAKDTYGNPVPGVSVTFTAPASGASGTFATSSTVTTNANGISVSPVFTANATAGTYTVSAAATGLTTQNFTLTNSAGASSGLSISAGNNQSATVGADFATLLKVRATDSNGNPVPNVAVTFTVNANGASASFASTTAVNTDATGYATASKLTANTVSGVFTVTASATGLSPLTFTLTNNPGAASAIAISGGSGQAATVNTAFAQALQARVTDTYGNPVAGFSLTFTAPSTGASGTFASSSVVASNSTGYATAPAFTANTVSGTYNVTVSGTGLTSKSISLTNNAGAATAISIQDGNNQSAAVGAAFVKTLQVIAKDTYGNAVPGVSVVFTAPSTGASGTFATSSTVTTNASGVAASPIFTANTAVGAYTVTAAATGLTTQNFSLTNTAGAAASIAVVDGNNQSAVIGNAFTKTLQVVAKDTYGNLVPGVSVTFTAPATGASGTFATSSTVTTNGSGVAVSPVFTANTVAGSYTITASATGVTSQNFSLTNTPGVAKTIAIVDGNNQSATVGAAFAKTLQVVAKDNYGNVVPGVSVAFTAPSTGATGTFATSSTITTDANGLAVSPTFTANTVSGTYSVTAASSGLTSLNFNLTNTPGAAASLAIVDGNNQSATVNAAFVKTLQVVAKDTYGNVVPGVSVVFTAPGTGASGTFATSSTVTTNASGVAVSPAFTANTVSGTYLVSAASTGLTTLNFSLTNNPGAASSITILDGNSQSATVGTVFAKVLQVIAKDTYGNAVPGVSVTFTAPSTGASGTFAGATTIATNASGVASSTALTANTIAGTYNVTASATGLTSQNFSLTNQAGSTSTLSLTAGNSQSATVGTDFATLLQVRATDANGNPVPNLSVTFTVNANGAGASFASSGTVATTNTGYATAPKLTANTISGVFTVTASAAGLTPLTFTLTNNPGAAATITVSNGNSQSATVNTAFAQALQVRVTDSYGNPVGNVPVSFTAPSSGATGSFTGSASVTTNATGYASAPTFTANTVAGSYTVTAASTGLTSKTISLTNTPGAAASLTIQDGNNQSATVGTAFAKSLQLVVKDSYGNLVPGASVTFTAPSTGASGSFATSSTVTSNASGVAVSPAFTANTAAGGYNIAASSSGVSSVNFGMTNTSAAAAAITIVDGNNQSAAVSTAFAKQLQVIAKDSYGNPVSGVSVVFTAPASGAGGTFAGSSTILTGASGIAIAPAFTANAQAGSYNVTASATGLASLNFSLTNTVGAASALTIVAGNNQSATVGTDFATLLKVRATDSNGNPVPNTAITFTINNSGAGGTFAASGVVNTDASGYATAPKLTANTVAGSFTVTAGTSGGSSLTINLSNKAGAATGLVLSGGNAQVATVNTAFGQALQIRAVDAYGNGVANVPVTFSVPSSGATASFTTSNIVSTDASGYATAPTLTANTIAGSYNVTASSTGLASQIFSLTNNPGATAALVIQDGNLQSATVNTDYGRLFQVIAKDAYGNPVPGVSVVFKAPSSGAGGSFAATSSVVTDSGGIATAPAFKAGTVAGAFQVTAASTGLTTQYFALTNLPGVATSLAIVAGNNQTATVGNSFATTLQVLATDSFGNGVPGVQVLYTAPGSGASGSFAGSNLVTTNSQGIAVASPFTANAVSGSYTVTASAPGLNTQTFSLTNSTGGALINITGGNSQTTTVGTGFGSALQVKFTDSFGNPVPGISVTFSAPASGPGVTFGGPATVVSNASGVATSPAITANGKAGSFMLAASAANIGSVNFNLTNTPGAAAAIVAASGNNQSATVNTPFGLPVVARVTDTYGNPVANVPVTFSEPGSGALAIFGGSSVVTSNAEGIVSSPNLSANTISGSYAITASAPNVTSAQFTLTNTAGLPTAIVKTDGNNQAAVVNSAFASALAVKVSDIYGNPVPNVNVSFSGPVIGSGLAFSGASTVQTNAQGIAASPGISANSAAGSFSVQAYVSGSVTESFSLTNLAGSASKLSLVGGNNQNTIVNMAFGAPLQLIVTDAYNNPVNNATVTFTSPSNGSGVIITGSPSASSNASGQVSWSGFMANQVAGTYPVFASLANGTNVPFSLTNKAGAAAIANVVAGSNQSATVNVAYAAPLQLKVTDAYGNPVPNVPVSFSVPATGASVTFASQSAVNSSADGLVSSPAFTANTVAGNFIATATVGSIGQVNFNLSNMAGAAAQILKSSGNNQSTQVDTAFANPLQLKVTDAYGNPVANAQVQFKLPATGATAIPASSAAVSTNLQGLATLPSLTASRQAGSFQVNLSAGTNITESFTLANLAGPAAKFNIMAGSSQSTMVNTAFATGLKVLVTDAFNNPVANVPVALTVPTSGPSALVSGNSTITTSASGFAELAGLTANTVAGSFTVVASVPGLDSLNFSFTNTAGAAANLGVVSGGGQSAVVRALFTAPLVVKVTDTYGNPVAGTAVTFTSPATGATLDFAGPATVNTDISGIAQAPSASAGANFGNFSVTATAPGLKPATFSLTNSPPTLQGITVQQGSIGRSFVRYVDLAINDAATVSAIVSSLATAKPLIRLTNTGLDGKTKKAVSLAGIAKASGNVIQIDFGAKGLGGNATSNAADGSYLIELDIDGNGTFETSQRFFRLLGDVNGDKVVDAKDSALVKASLNKTGTNLPADTNGDGKVNASDTSYVQKAQKRKIKI